MRALVTGAFSNIGASAAEQLVASGTEVRTLTNREPRGRLADIETHALRFDPEHLVRAMQGVDVVINSYWVRTPSHGATFAEGIHNSRMLVDAALTAGVRRFVQISVTHTNESSRSPYYAGKAVVDDYVRSQFDDHAIVQPSLVVGAKDVLTSNMAWFVRRMPVIPVPADGFELQPVLLDDLGGLVADAATADGTTQLTIEAVGPERYTFRSYLRLLASAAGLRRRFPPAPEVAFVAGTWFAGKLLRDDLVTRDEMDSLRKGYLLPAGDATCTGSVAAWLHENIDVLGHCYVNDSKTRRESARRARTTN